jgi:hypothetical protein
MLNDFEFSDLGIRRDRASGAYFAASQLLVGIRQYLPADVAEQATAQVLALGEEHKRLRREMLTAYAERKDAAQKLRDANRAEFEARYEAQRKATSYLQTA